MRTLFWLIVVTALAVTAALLAQFNDGNVAIFAPPYRIDISLNFFLLLLAVALLVIYWLSRLAHHLAEFPRRVVAYRGYRETLGSLRALREAVLAQLEGRYARVERAAQSAQAAPDAAATAALLAARAAHQMQEYERRDDWLARAGSDGSVNVARLVSSAQMWSETHEVERADAALAELQRAAGRHIHAARISLGVAAQARRWDEVLRDVRRLVKRKALHALAANRYTVQAYLGLLQEHAQDPDELVAACRRISPTELRRPELAAAAAKLLAQAQRGDVAAELLEAAIDAEYSTALVDVYGQVAAAPYRPRIEKASEWLVQHPDDAALLRCLGLLCERDQLWGKARSYLEQSARQQADPRTSLALARVAEATDDGAAAQRHYRDAALGFARATATGA